MKQVLVLVVVLAVVLVGPAHGTITNIGFESDTAGWTILSDFGPDFVPGSAAVVGNFSGTLGPGIVSPLTPFSYDPAEGSKFLLLGGGDWGMPVTATQTFTASAGVIKGMAAFVSPQEKLGDFFVNDFASVEVFNSSGFYTKAFYKDVDTAGSFAHTPWLEWTVSLLEPGEYTIQYTVENVVDAGNPSYALFDAPASTGGSPVPVPPSLFLLAPGLLGLIGLRKRAAK